jgi:drug/metabolite transporter (DMT)-like permease
LKSDQVATETVCILIDIPHECGELPSTHMNESSKSLMLINLSTVLMGIISIFPKIIILPPKDIIFFRSVFAALVLILYIGISGKSLRLSNRNEYGLMAVMGVLLATHWVSFFYSIQVSTVAIGIISFFTYPVMTAILEPLFLNKSIRLPDIVITLIVSIGVLFIIPEFSFQSKSIAGILFGLLSAFLYALRNVLQKKYLVSRSGTIVMFYQILVVAISLFFFLTPSSIQVSGKSLVWLTVLGVLLTALPHTLYIKSLMTLKATTVSVINSLQPVYAVIFAMMILQERPAARTLIGGSIIFLASLYEGIRVSRDSNKILLLESS